MLLLADTEAPDVAINSPADGATVQGDVPIYGTVTDDNPDHYYLVVKDSDGHVVAGPGTVAETSSFTNELLYTFDSTSVDDGNYTVWLAARDAAGNRDAGSLATAVVTVNNTPDNKDQCKSDGWMGFTSQRSRTKVSVFRT